LFWQQVGHLACKKNNPAPALLKVILWVTRLTGNNFWKIGSLYLRFNSHFPGGPGLECLPSGFYWS